MKRLLVIASLLVMAVSAQAQKSTATLVCRMGGSMVWSVINQMDAVQTQINGKNVRVPVISALFAQLVFNRAGAAVSPTGAGLAAGTCGWTDRAMRQNESNRVVEMLDTATFQQTVLYGNGSTVGGGASMGGGHLNPQINSVFTMSVTRDDPSEVQYTAAPGSIKVIGK